MPHNSHRPNFILYSKQSFKTIIQMQPVPLLKPKMEPYSIAEIHMMTTFDAQKRLFVAMSMRSCILNSIVSILKPDTIILPLVYRQNMKINLVKIWKNCKSTLRTVWFWRDHSKLMSGSVPNQYKIFEYIFTG